MRRGGGERGGMAGWRGLGGKGGPGVCPNFQICHVYGTVPLCESHTVSSKHMHPKKLYTGEFSRFMTWCDV